MDVLESDVYAGLTGIRRGLEADGYLIDVEIGDVLTVNIVAGPGACEDCLVSKTVMKGIVGEALRDLGLELNDEEIELRYPTD